MLSSHPQDYVGRSIRKKFGQEWFRGEVTAFRQFDTTEVLYWIEYEDGDEEELSHEELLQALVEKEHTTGTQKTVHVDTAKHVTTEAFTTTKQESKIPLQQVTGTPTSTESTSRRPSIQALKSLQVHLECPICLDILEDTHIIPECMHRFCGKCIKQSLYSCNHECPSCRIHVPTRRSLRQDFVLDGLIASLSYIIESAESSSISGHEDDDLDEMLLDYLKAVEWQLRCPICLEQLQQTHVSSECFHRFCKNCITRDDDEEEEMSLTCPSCNVTPTNFCEDKQFDEIVTGISNVVKSVNETANEAASEKDSSTTTASFGSENISDDTMRKEIAPTVDMKTVTSTINSNAAATAFVDHNFDGKRPNLLSRADTITYLEPTNLNDEADEVKENGSDTAKREGDAHSVATSARVEQKERKKSTNQNHDDEQNEHFPAVVKPRYPTGTRFVASDSKKIGRIIGYDHNRRLYQVYYPQDGSCASVQEALFDEVKLIGKRSKRPSQWQRLIDKRRQVKNDCIQCPKCKETFSSNPNETTFGTVPLQSQKCSHVICMDCIQSNRFIHQNSGRMRSTVDCPLCGKPQAFNAAEPMICLPMCQMVSLYQKMEQKRHDENKERQKDEKLNTQLKHCGNEIIKMKRDKDCRNPSKESSKRRKHNGQKESRESWTKLRCTTCKKEKVTEKFSSKQVERSRNGKERVFCRRCEEKSILKSKLGSGFEKVSTTLLVAKEPGKRPKFLSTIVPWNSGAPLRQSIGLPANLILDGYSREPWSRFSNEDAEQEKLWTKHFLWSTGDGIAGFLRFLQDHKKSAFGTFLLDDETDGFFVIPFDQGPLEMKDIFQCKFILGLGLVGKKEDDRSGLSDLKESADDSTLHKLLAASLETNQCLELVPKGSVKAAPTPISRPKRPPSHSGGPSDWFRPRVIIEEEETVVKSRNHLEPFEVPPDEVVSNVFMVESNQNVEHAKERPDEVQSTFDL